MVFALITMVGVAYVGATYARLDRLLFDDTYRVVAHFEDSGGIFAGAGVSYRGVTVGKVGALEVTDDGVDVILEIDDDSDPIPLDTNALVANRSAVGEQYVDLLPNTDEGPHLGEDSEIPREKTQTPIPTMQLLVDLDRMVNSVDKGDLRTVVSEMGKAFDGTGESLGQIIDTSNSFIETANENFDVTTRLINDGNTVLQTQLDSTGQLRSFARDLALLSDTLVASDGDLRRVIDNGSATANQLRTFLEDNQVNLGEWSPDPRCPVPAAPRPRWGRPPPPPTTPASRPPRQARRPPYPLPRAPGRASRDARSPCWPASPCSR